jgi:hypothetical protein
VVFSNTGTQVFELIDTTANSGSGVLVVLDAVGRIVSNTLAIPFSPTALLMAPDGFNAYVIGQGEAGTYKILYYDLLSGTADLTVTVPAADVFFSPYHASQRTDLWPEQRQDFCVRPAGP